MISWAPLRVKVFRALWLANVVSNIGGTMHDTAAVWTMTTLSHSPTFVTLMPVMASLPIFLFALPAGALADLVDRRLLILLAQVGALLTAAGLAVLAYFQMLSPGLLLLASFQLGIATAVTTPAWQALIPELVGREQLPSALALGGVGMNVARALGPVAGGMLVSATGPAAVFGLNAISFAGLVAVLAGHLRKGEAVPRSAEQEQMLGAMVAALRYARHAPAMKAVLFRAGVQVFGAVAPVALLPVFVRLRGWTGADYGWLMGSYGAGAIVAALFVLPWLRARLSSDRVLAVSALFSALAAGSLRLEPSIVLTGLALAFAGAGWMCTLNTLSVAAQSVFPNWVRARSSAIHLVVVMGSIALGAATWGQLTSHFGVALAFTVAGIWLLLALGCAWWRPIGDVEKLDLTPSNHWPEHHLATEPAPEDGPVLITIEYLIDADDVHEFRAAMRDLRETRLRDGAFRCSLFRDLNNPTLFRETYLVGSWAEHLRQHRRVTVEDQRVEAKVLAFHRGEERPAVRHLLMVNFRPPRGEEEVG